MNWLFFPLISFWSFKFKYCGLEDLWMRHFGLDAEWNFGLQTRVILG